MTLKPLGDRVLVKPAPKEEKTSTGLYLIAATVKTFRAGYIYTFFIHRNSLRETLLQDKFD